jgi:hypothetical protein
MKAASRPAQIQDIDLPISKCSPYQSVSHIDSTVEFVFPSGHQAALPKLKIRPLSKGVIIR